MKRYMVGIIIAALLACVVALIVFYVRLVERSVMG